MKADEVGEEELAVVFDTLDVELQRIRREAEKRPDDAGEPGRPVTALGGYFDSPPPASGGVDSSSSLRPLAVPARKTVSARPSAIASSK
jgi:hypothetical protein